MPKVLITGIDGFTGRYIKAELQLYGYTEVFGTTLNKGDHDEHEYQLDLLDQHAVEKLIVQLQPDVVIHLAAISSVDEKNISNLYQTNIVGTRNLLQALAKNGRCKNVILASSGNIYGNNQVPFDGISELSIPVPENDYAVSKFAMEMMARQWSGDLPITITRPFNYSGVGQSNKFLLPKIVEHFAAHKEIISLGNVDVSRDYSDVRDIARMYRVLIQKPSPGGVFNLCSGKASSIAEIIAMLRTISGHDLKVRVDPDFVRDHEIKYLKGSNQSVVRHIGSYEFFSLFDTLEWMFEAASH